MPKTYAWPTRGPSKEAWLPSQSVVGTGDIAPVKPDPDWAEERLVKALARGDLNTPQKVARLASQLGWQVDFLESRLNRSDIRLRVIAQIRLRALQATAAAIDSQAELAKTDIAAFKVMLQTAEVLTVGGPSVNVAIDARKVGDTNSDRRFFESYHRRIEAHMEVHDPPTEPVEPEETIVGDVPEDLEDTAEAPPVDETPTNS
jgi:hypothetical protein